MGDVAGRMAATQPVPSLPAAAQLAVAFQLPAGQPIPSGRPTPPNLPTQPPSDQPAGACSALSSFRPDQPVPSELTAGGFRGEQQAGDASIAGAGWLAGWCAVAGSTPFPTAAQTTDPPVVAAGPVVTGPITAGLVSTPGPVTTAPVPAAGAVSARPCSAVPDLAFSFGAQARSTCTCPIEASSSSVAPAALDSAAAAVAPDGHSAGQLASRDISICAPTGMRSPPVRVARPQSAPDGVGGIFSGNVHREDILPRSSAIAAARPSATRAAPPAALASSRPRCSGVSGAPRSGGPAATATAASVRPDVARESAVSTTGQATRLRPAPSLPPAMFDEGFPSPPLSSVRAAPWTANAPTASCSVHRGRVSSVNGDAIGADAIDSCPAAPSTPERPADDVSLIFDPSSPPLAARPAWAAAQATEARGGASEDSDTAVNAIQISLNLDAPASSPPLPSGEEARDTLAPSATGKRKQRPRMRSCGTTMFAGDAARAEARAEALALRVVRKPAVDSGAPGSRRSTLPTSRSPPPPPLHPPPTERIQWLLATSEPMLPKDRQPVPLTAEQREEVQRFMLRKREERVQQIELARSIEQRQLARRRQQLVELREQQVRAHSEYGDR